MVSATPFVIVATLPDRPLVFPQFQPCGSEVQVPKLPESEEATLIVRLLVAVCCGKDESFAVSVTA